MNLSESSSTSSSKAVSIDMKKFQQLRQTSAAAPLPAPLSSRRQVYADSRKLEAETAAFLHDFAVQRENKLAEVPEVDEDGFMTVKNGFKPEEAAKKAEKEEEKLRFDFYRFQQKERKLNEWREEQIRHEQAVEEVQRLKKKRRFNL